MYLEINMKKYDPRDVQTLDEDPYAMLPPIDVVPTNEVVNEAENVYRELA